MVVESYSQEILQEGEAELAAPPEEAVIISDNSEFIVKVSLNAACVSHDTTRTDAERHAWTTGVLVTSKPHWTVKQLAKRAEEAIRDKFCLAVSTALVLALSRDSAAPFYGLAADFFADEGCAELVGDISRIQGASSQQVHGTRVSSANAGPGNAEKVPVTILTGFLGAGKTTMLNYLLHVQRDKRIAVIENEFGEVPIDGDLLADGDGLSAAEQVVVLDNGCMCCTVRGDLLGAFASVLHKMEDSTSKGGGRALDSVLVETTGMADPVPIVRTLLQTPAIAGSFSLDGVVTLVDAKNLLSRLMDGEHELMTQEKQEEGPSDTVDEAFQQIMFSDRIVINKVDLVSASTAVDVYQRVRSINESAGIVSCSRGKLDPAELEGLGAFDRLLKESEDMLDAGTGLEHDHDHSHGHSHGHGDHGDEHCEGGDGCTEGHGDYDGHQHEEGQECSLDHDHSAHDHQSRHSSQVGTFSLVKESTEVLGLLFARWVRSLAFLPKDKGTLFRSKAVLAVAGSDRKLVFHAVSDVMERREAGRWDEGENRSCRIVFIGKRLDRAFLEEGFNATARAVVKRPVAEVSERAVKGEGESVLESLATRVSMAFFGVMRQLGTGDVMRVAVCCSALSDAVNGGAAMEHYKSLAADDKASAVARKGFHLAMRRSSSPRLYLHHLVSAPTARSYAQAAAGAKLEMTSSMGPGQSGIAFNSAEEIEAAGITWAEVEQLADPLAKNFVVEFSWRAETMASFFTSPDSSTSSAMVKIEYEVEDEDAFDEETDTLKFRLVLRPETEENNQASSAQGPTSAAVAGPGEGGALPLHRLMIQTVGGRSCSQVYGLSFHSISPSFQVHVQVPDHRVPYFQTDQLFHKWHPLMDHLKKEPRLRFLVRMKPDGSGPLDNMCGCC